ncbi:MAG: ribosome-associated translation inhibitor RaiA [Bacteroidales bacterium]|nr:ribosome-associated translation inhibitor RaiA [Bacteroidales bacterium]HPD96628.1 ribosome-associated translation inhibitor RaiA [Tenuifilaceae bacterium]HRX32266.1 ribosome-associated translation inhibitor RaiA [Tenuifilaceae bacterium]
MNIKIQSIKFDADKKLVDFINKKVSKIEKFFDNIVKVEVYLRLENTQELENKVVEIRIDVPGSGLFAERKAKSFEEAVDGCIDAIKAQIQRHKDRLRGN